MIEVHTGICGDHLGGKNLAQKLLRQGVFWPTMRKDCEDFVKRCHSCQLFGRVNHAPHTDFSPVLSPCPFFMWGIDIMGPFPKGTGQKQFLVVAVDYVTKWVEAKPLARICEKEMIEFFMEFIVFRFGVPRIVVTDNGTQFIGKDFEDTLKELKIKHVKASVAYPQSNGQVEATNKIILQGLKKRLQDAQRTWVNELPNVLWEYRTSPRSTTKETPFRMTYGTEAILPMDINLDTPRVEFFDVGMSEEGLHIDNDLVEEVKEAAQFRTTLYQQKTASYFNKKVKPRQFQVNDLVLRESASSMPLITGKLKALWEGPYKISKVIRPGTYELQTMDNVPVKNSWNAFHLKKYFQ